MANSYEQYAFRSRAPDVKKAVLLVIDMQEYFRGMATPIVPAIQATINLARRAHVPVIYTQHSHKGPSDYGMLHEWWDGDLIKAGSTEAELMPEVRKLEVSVISLWTKAILQISIFYFNYPPLSIMLPGIHYHS